MDVEVNVPITAKVIIRPDDLKHLELRGVTLHRCVLGQGSYGTVYKAEHKGIACAAKRVDHELIRELSLVNRMRQNFLLECLLHSQLSGHPNIVKMLGVFYSEGQALPVLVMELMEYDLTKLLEKFQNIPIYVKLSILQDVSRGLCYLHAQNPPIVHQALYSDNILVTKGLTAKIGDFKTGAETLSDQVVLSVRRNRAGDGFLPYSRQSCDILKYNMQLNVFSFGCIICHVITQKMPVSPSMQQNQPGMLTSFIKSPSRTDHISPKPKSTIFRDKGQCQSPSAWLRAPRTRVTRRRKLEYDYSGLMQSCTIDEWSVRNYQDSIDLISDHSLKQLVEACLQHNCEDRPYMLQVNERIVSIMTEHCNDDNIKKAYSLAMKEGLDQSRNFQLLLVGAENTGKTSLISSFLGEKFVEEQSATKGTDIEVCKVYCKDWIRISHSDKTSILHNQFTDQCKDNVLKKLANSPLLLEMPLSLPYASRSSYSSPSKKSSITHYDVLFTTVPLTKSIMSPSPTKNIKHFDVLFSSAPISNPVMAPPTSDAGGDSSKPLPQGVHDVPIISLWDFAGQVIFHNSHSVFISDGGVCVITFNASMELTDKIIPRGGSPQPPECCTIISSIHYWLQAINSVCSVKENVLLAGTHIDELHPDLKEARKIAREKVLPKLLTMLCRKQYVRHIASISGGLRHALEQSCFFLSNKCRDEEIERLKAAAVKVATALRKEKPIFFLKIEQALLQLNEQIISVSTMLELVAKNAFSLDKNSPEFKGILKYFHNNRTILHFSQIRSLKDLVILSPNWLAKLFSYVIAAQSYKVGNEYDWAWERLIKYGILHECLLQHMLNKFHSDYPLAGSIQVTKQQTVDILMCFHLVARITSMAWFAEEGLPPLPESGATFIVPSLVRADDVRNPPHTKQERIIYFMFKTGFVPTSLLNQVIAKCICRSVRRNDRLLWMRYGKMGSQLGVDQKYYISRCEEKQSIQLTITVVGNDEEHIEERRILIHDITKSLDEIMEVFMPSAKEKPSLLIPCEFCPKLHILLDDAYSGKIIFCPNADDRPLACGYYRDLLQGGLPGTIIETGVNKKLKVFTAYYSRLIHLDFKGLCSQLLTAKIIQYEDIHIIQGMVEPSKAASHVLGKISTSLQVGIDELFQRFLSVLENHDDLICAQLAKEIRRDLSPNVVASASVGQPGYQAIESSSRKFTVTRTESPLSSTVTVKKKSTRIPIAIGRKNVHVLTNSVGGQKLPVSSRKLMPSSTHEENSKLPPGQTKRYRETFV